MQMPGRRPYTHTHTHTHTHKLHANTARVKTYSLPCTCIRNPAATTCTILFYIIMNQRSRTWATNDRTSFSVLLYQSTHSTHFHIEAFLRQHLHNCSRLVTHSLKLKNCSLSASIAHDERRVLAYKINAGSFIVCKCYTPSSRIVSRQFFPSPKHAVTLRKARVIGA